jgi:hypothetical protein
MEQRLALGGALGGDLSAKSCDPFFFGGYCLFDLVLSVLYVFLLFLAPELNLNF